MKASWSLNYPCKKHSTIEGQATSIGPDGYRFILLSRDSIVNHLKNKETKDHPFIGVKLNVGNLESSKNFYINVLGMKEFNSDISNYLKGEDNVALGYESPNNAEVNLCVFFW